MLVKIKKQKNIKKKGSEPKKNQKCTNLLKIYAETKGQYSPITSKINSKKLPVNKLQTKRYK